MISCYLRAPIDARIALSGLGDALIMAKDGFGRFYNREWDFSNMGEMMAGRGYLLKTSREAELVYRLRMEDEEALSFASPAQSPKFFAPHPNTGSNMSLLVFGAGFEGVEVGVFAGGELAGSGVIQDGKCGIAVWGDDPSTESVDGAAEGGRIEVKILQSGVVVKPDYNQVVGDGIYETNDFEAIELQKTPAQPVEFGIRSVSPNPFNDRTKLAYGLNEAGVVNISIYDLSGRLVSQAFQGKMEAGGHTFQIDASGLSNGIYVVEVRAKNSVSRTKIGLIR